MSRMVKPIFSSISANDLGLNRFICVSPSVVDFSFNSNMSNPRPLGVVRHNIPPRGRSEYIFLTNATGLIRCSRSSKQPTRETSEKTVSSSISSIGFSMTSSPFSRQDSARQGEGSTTMQREKRFESLTSFAKTPDPAPISRKLSLSLGILLSMASPSCVMQPVGSKFSSLHTRPLAGAVVIPCVTHVMPPDLENRRRRRADPLPDQCAAANPC